MPTTESHQLKENTVQYLFFRILYDIADYVTWGYYTILLLRASDNAISVIFLNQTILYAGIFIGFVLGSMLINRSGYLGTYRIANALLLLSCFLTLLTLPQVLEVHLVLALIRGIGRAFFYVGHNMFYTNEIHGLNRSRLVNLLISISYIFGIVFPFFIGGAITVYGYEWIFIVGAGLYGFGIVIPWTFNKVPKQQFDMAELKPLMRRRGFKRWSTLTLSAEFINTLKVQSLSIIPFLLLKSEFEVGLLASALAIAAAFMTFAHRNDKFRRKVQLGYIGGFIVSISNLILAVFWNIPALILRGLGANVGMALYSPPVEEISYRNKESVLGNFLEESTIEVDLYVEALLFIGRMAACITLVLALVLLNIQGIVMLQALMLIIAFSEILILWLNMVVNKVLRRGGSTETTYYPPLVPAPLAVHKI